MAVTFVQFHVLAAKSLSSRQYFALTLTGQIFKEEREAQL